MEKNAAEIEYQLCLIKKKALYNIDKDSVVVDIRVRNRLSFFDDLRMLRLYNTN